MFHDQIAGTHGPVPLVKQKRIASSLKVYLLVLLCLSIYGLPCSATEPRAMLPDDLMRLERLDGRQVTISGDGVSIAYVLQRPRALATRFGHTYLGGNDRADVWIADGARGRVQNITHGEADGSGFWGPKWSPDGRWLAMYSTRGGNVRLWVWNRSLGHTQILSEKAVELLQPDGFIWISDHELIFATLTREEKPSLFTTDTRTPEIAQREWSKNWIGKEPTASVLASGLPHSADDTESQIVVADVTTGRKRVISSAPGFAEVSLSPDHRSIAFLSQVGLSYPEPDRPLQANNRRYEALVATLAPKTTVVALAAIWEPFWGSLRWSPDSNELALMGRGSKGADPQVWRCVVTGGQCEPATDASMKLHGTDGNTVERPPYLWCGKRTLLIHAERIPVPPSVSKEHLVWWVSDGKGKTRELFGGMKDAPTHLLAEPWGAGLIGIIDGKVWRIATDGIPLESLTPNQEPNITSIDGSLSTITGESGVFILHAAGAGGLFRLDVRSHVLEPIATPDKDATLVASANYARTNVFLKSDNTGTYLWVKRNGRDGFWTLLKTNTFLRAIDEGELRNVEYRTADGQDLTAWLILPFGFREKIRYPVVVWVYPETIYGPSCSTTCKINSDATLNLQLLAARGYVVLLPSMPLKPRGEASDPYFELTNGVIPAVDKLVEIGIADPNRLGVMGQSYGGYGVYGLITQTDRFKAAVASAGMSDLVSLYGTFDARDRYQRSARDNEFQMSSLETGQGRMGGPPWRDIDRYLRNSPLTHVEHIRTPLLIIQGDLDYVPIEQGEEFFTALYRQNKQAEFVRYWGEGHVLDSPANIRDMWHRVYAWLDEFLRSTPREAHN
jgi:dipeptidyl aminopeptidase/acylaminoacyl peptidase